MTILPQADGYLPYYLLFVSHPSFNRQPASENSSDEPRPSRRRITLQPKREKLTPSPQLSILAAVHVTGCYTLPTSASLKQFNGPNRPAPEPPALLARVFGFKNMYTGLIRLYAAYNIENAPLYDLATLTIVGVLALYASEMLVFRTARAQEMAGPLVQASVALVWMVWQREYYTGNALL